MPVARSVESISLSNQVFGLFSQPSKDYGPMINVAAIRMQQLGCSSIKHR